MTIRKQLSTNPEQVKAADQARKLLLAELKHFRVVVHQTLASFQLKLEGEIEQVAELFSNKKMGVTDEDIISHKKAVDDMTAGLRSLKIKTNKGRKKDVKKIEQIIDELREKTDIIT